MQNYGVLVITNLGVFYGSRVVINNLEAGVVVLENVLSLTKNIEKHAKGMDDAAHMAINGPHPGYPLPPRFEEVQIHNVTAVIKCSPKACELFDQTA